MSEVGIPFSFFLAMHVGKHVQIFQIFSTISRFEFWLKCLRSWRQQAFVGITLLDRMFVVVPPEQNTQLLLQPQSLFVSILLALEGKNLD